MEAFGVLGILGVIFLLAWFLVSIMLPFHVRKIRLLMEEQNALLQKLVNMRFIQEMENKQVLMDMGVRPKGTIVNELR